MHSQPKISVIVLIYNVEQYIKKCVEHLYKQSLDSIEYIFVDDCSTDNSIAILRRIMKKYPHRADDSLIISNHNNLGQAQSRINGIKYAHGKYVTFCDSDDFVPYDAYNNLYEYAESTNCDIIACDYFRIYNGNQNKECYSGNDTCQDWIKNILLCKKIGALWCHLIKINLLSDLLCPRGNMMEDAVILMQCLLKANKVSTYRKPLYYYI